MHQKTTPLFATSYFELRVLYQIFFWPFFVPVREAVFFYFFPAASVSVVVVTKYITKPKKSVIFLNTTRKDKQTVFPSLSHIIHKYLYDSIKIKVSLEDVDNDNNDNDDNNSNKNNNIVYNYREEYQRFCRRRC